MIESSNRQPAKERSMTLYQVLKNDEYNILIESIGDVIKGFNTTIFAYGQTGSGKTYTMFGPHWEDNLGFQNTIGPGNSMMMG